MGEGETGLTYTLSIEIFILSNVYIAIKDQKNLSQNIVHRIKRTLKKWKPHFFL